MCVVVCERQSVCVVVCEVIGVKSVLGNLDSVQSSILSGFICIFIVYYLFMSPPALKTKTYTHLDILFMSLPGLKTKTYTHLDIFC